MKNWHLYIGLILLSCSVVLGSWKSKLEVSKNEGFNEIRILEPDNQVVRDDVILISINSEAHKSMGSIKLVVAGTYGTSVLKPTEKKAKWYFEIPPSISRRTGVIDWNLVDDQKVLQSGQFQLTSLTQKLGQLENYLGPHSIVASERDYTMVVAIPTDSLDNLLPDGTTLSLNYQFKNEIVRSPARLNHGFAFQRIPAPLSTGRITVGSTLQNISSKELVADVFPDIAVDFQITVDQDHNYADGNAITTFKSSQITDMHGNIMTDGTLVEFFMGDEYGNYWQTMGSTINGYAFAKALHPQIPATWNVRAVIHGIAESPELNVTYKSVIDSIPVRLQKEKTLIVGPLTSYLGQIIPDGVQVSIEIDGIKHNLLTESGMVKIVHEGKLDLDETINITALGVTKTSKIGSLENE